MMLEDDIVRRYSLGQKLWWLILGRVIAALFLFSARAIWVRGSGHRAWATMLPALVAICGLTVLYVLLRRFSRALVFQVRFQFLIDIILVTWLVWTTDVIHSPYIALYIVVIAASSLFLSPRDAIVMSVACAVAFTTSALVVLNGSGRLPTQDLLNAGRAQTFQSIGLFDIAFLVVGLLSARLAERQSRSDVRLKAAAQSLATLRALHERIVESIRSGLVTTDLQGRIYSFNAAAEEITGYDEADVRGQDASIFFGDIKQILADSMYLAPLGEASPRFEADCLTADGLRLRLGFSVSPLFSELGKKTGTVITFMDLTHIRALEEASRRQDRLAAIGRMAASIAHEIRNPLAAMRGSIQMLRAEMEGNSEQAQLMEIILRESDRLNKIVADYLSYARPRPAQMNDVDPAVLLQDTFKLLSNSSEVSARHRLELDLPVEPIIVKGDEEQLRQVFWNVARNALKAMPHEGMLRASLERAGNSRACLSFTDTGCGMTAEQVERLFEPFSSTTGSTGLGLSIVYQIIRDHSGTINVRSRLGEGTMITIELPEEQQEAGARSN